MLTPQMAPAAGVMEMGPISQWANIEDDVSCGVKMSFDYGHALEIVHNSDNNTLRLNVLFDQPILDTQKIYETDIYIDVDLNIFVSAQPLNTQTISFELGDEDKFLAAADNAREVSLGLRDTLYIFDLKETSFPSKVIRHCIDKSDSPNPMEFLDDLDFLGGDDRNAKKDIKPAISGDVEAPMAPKSESAPVPYEIQAFLDQESVEVMSPEKTNESVAPTAQSTSEAVKDAIETARIDPDQYVLPVVPAKKPLRKYLPKMRVSSKSINIPKPEVVDISDIDSQDLPERLQGLENYLSDDINYDESQELIDSLLIQIDMLEKEKEALRQRFEQDFGPMSVIRSCKKEKSTITNLSVQLKKYKSEVFELRKQQEIEDDLLEICESANKRSYPKEQEARVSEETLQEITDIYEEENDILEAQDEAQDELLGPPPSPQQNFEDSEINFINEHSVTPRDAVDAIPGAPIVKENSEDLDLHIDGDGKVPDENIDIFKE